MKVYIILIREYNCTLIEAVYSNKEKAEARFNEIRAEWLEEAAGCDIDEHKNFLEITNCDDESSSVWISEAEVQ